MLYTVLLSFYYVSKVDHRVAIISPGSVSTCWAGGGAQIHVDTVLCIIMKDDHFWSLWFFSAWWCWDLSIFLSKSIVCSISSLSRISLFIHSPDIWLTFRFFPLWDSFVLNCNEYLITSLDVEICFISLGLILGVALMCHINICLTL